MEGVDYMLNDIEAMLLGFQKHIRAYRVNTAASSAKSSLVSAETALSKARDLESQTEEALKTATGMEARRAKNQFKLLQTKIANAAQELDQVKQHPTKKDAQKASTLDDMMVVAAQKKQENVNLLSDINKNCSEAGVIGNVVIDNLEKQNEQLRKIGNKATKIEANAKTGTTITNRMIKCERIIKIVLWLSAVIFLALSGLGFYVFHHNTGGSNPLPDPEPEPTPDPTGYM